MAEIETVVVHSKRDDAAVAAILARGFTPDQLEWKVQAAGTKKTGGVWARIVPYITSRGIIERLDEAFGVSGYDITLTPTTAGSHHGVKASIVARWPSGVVTIREDLAELTDIEPMKGGASGAIKRGAVLYRIGAYLYQSPDFWANILDDGDFPGKAKDGTKFRWSVPLEALQWAQMTAGEGPRETPAVSAPSRSNAPSSPATPSQKPSPPASTAAPATPSSSSSGKSLDVMPGREGWFKGFATTPIVDVPSEVLAEASEYYSKRINEKPDDRWVDKSKSDLAVIAAELVRRGGQPDLADEGGPGLDDDIPFPEDEDDLPW